MPIVTRVDPDKRLVIVKVSGVMEDAETFNYQLTTWSRRELAGYDELIDMSDVTEIALPSVSRARELAQLSAEMDKPGPPGVKPGRMVIVAPHEASYAIGKMFEAFREMNPRNIKDVTVVRTMAEALMLLGIEGPLET
jgi:hypothetical protein